MLYRRFFDGHGLKLHRRKGPEFASADAQTEKDQEKSLEKEERGEVKDRERRTLNGHQFSTVSTLTQVTSCHQCSKPFNTKEAFLCTNCNAHVHKGCREGLSVCAKVKLKVPKQQFAVPDIAILPVVTLRTKKESKPVSRERPWSAIMLPEDRSLLMLPKRRHTSIMPFHGSNLSKSISISNIAGHQVVDDMPIKGMRYLSQSTDTLCKTSKGQASTESLIDEGTEMIDSQLMGEFEVDIKEMEADSWSNIMDNNFLKHLKKDVINRQDVIYELIQTEMHHMRTLRIMAEVYSKGLQKERLLEPQMVDKVFPALDELLDLHTSLLVSLLERKRESQREGVGGGFIINKIGDILETQFSGPRAEIMKTVYGKFCSCHIEAVNLYKEMHSRDKCFQAFIRKKMSSRIVRRLSIPECILLVTQRITKYPVLMQRLLQHTPEHEEDHEALQGALRQAKDVITAVDGEVKEQQNKRRLKDVYTRTDSRSIMRMKSGQMFAREDLLRVGRLVHDGPLQLKNAQGRLKDVTAVLLSDALVFLQEKDQKYVFASLDQRSTVLSLQKLIIREVANEDRGIFLITTGINKPEMLEVHAASKEERNTWKLLIQDAMNALAGPRESQRETEEDEGILRETDEDRRLLETRAKAMREILRRKDEQILSLLEDKMAVFRQMCEVGTPPPLMGAGPDEATNQSPRTKALFRVGSRLEFEELLKGEPIMKDALLEVETLQALVNCSVEGAVGGQQVVCVTETARGGAGGMGPGPVCLPRRAETFGGFDSHQILTYKNGDKVVLDDPADLRRTESDGVLKKGGNTNLLRKQNSQVLQSVTHLHDLLSSLQAVVVQQDSLIEDQRQVLTSQTEPLPSSHLFPRPKSFIEQQKHRSLEKKRSLEKQRQDMAMIQQQLQENRRRETALEVREQQLADREVQILVQEEMVLRGRRELEAERQELQGKKEHYQKDLERLRDAQMNLDLDRERVNREMEQMETMRRTERQIHRTSSSTSDDSLHLPACTSLDRDPGDSTDQSSMSRDPGDSTDQSSMSRGDSLAQAEHVTLKAPNGGRHNHLPTKLLKLARDRRRAKKTQKYEKDQTGVLSADTKDLEAHMEGEVYFC
ncbi:hypothetical protein UPYG_G00164670 [Umbra pygmaea]|uniref:A-kinase anchor protein 13 n=1 Tax=Umbra pygmaea TaxID=75934 RepID=A0ABD0WS98_UMBPY